MRVLVTFGSKRGCTAGLAAWIGEALREEGLAVDVVPARKARHVEHYDAVLVGGALYALRWHRDASRFVLRHARALRGREVWFFSSGPLDDSAGKSELPPIPQVRHLMELAGARGHVTFGGALAPDAKGFVASKMARTQSGDWRDPARVKAWAHALALELHAVRRRAPARVPAELHRPWKLIALCLFAGLSGAFGGGSLVASNGAALQLPPRFCSTRPSRASSGRGCC